MKPCKVSDFRSASQKSRPNRCVIQFHRGTKCPSEQLMFLFCSHDVNLQLQSACGETRSSGHAKTPAASAKEIDGSRVETSASRSVTQTLRHLSCARRARTRTDLGGGPMSRCQIVPLSNWMTVASGE